MQGANPTAELYQLGCKAACWPTAYTFTHKTTAAQRHILIMHVAHVNDSMHGQAQPLPMASCNLPTLEHALLTSSFPSDAKHP
jgi:hypothetical protein